MHVWGGRALRPLTGSGGGLGLEQADAEVLGLIDALAVGFQSAVGDAEHELAAEHALQVDAVDDFFD